MESPDSRHKSEGKEVLEDGFRRWGHPKTPWTSVFLFPSPEMSFVNPHKPKGKGHSNSGDDRRSSRQY